MAELMATPRRGAPAPRGVPAGGPGLLGRLLETREVLPGQLLQVWHAPDIASRVRPGQYVLAGRPGVVEVLRAALPVAGWDRVRGTIDLQVSMSRQAPSSRLADLGPGEPADLAGPMGQGYDLDPKSHHLVAVGDAAGMPVLRGLAREAIAGGRQVLVLMAASTVAQVYPSSLLPDEVEYAVATHDGSLGHPGHVVELLAEFEAWADRCYAAGAPELLADLAAFAGGRDARLGVARLGRRPGRRPAPSDPAGARRRAWLQVAVPLDVACVLGVCLGCLVPATGGWRRACREGPTFAAGELAWEERA